MKFRHKFFCIIAAFVIIVGAVFINNSLAWFFDTDDGVANMIDIGHLNAGIVISVAQKEEGNEYRYTPGDDLCKADNAGLKVGVRFAADRDIGYSVRIVAKYSCLAEDPEDAEGDWIPTEGFCGLYTGDPEIDEAASEAVICAFKNEFVPVETDGVMYWYYGGYDHVMFGTGMALANIVNEGDILTAAEIVGKNVMLESGALTLTFSVQIKQAADGFDWVDVNEGNIYIGPPELPAA